MSAATPPSAKRPRSGSQPAVSVIVPAYNAAAYIADTLESVLTQTYPDYEAIVVNDGSPDTEAFEHAIWPYLGRITYLTQENRGPAAARNLGIRNARGEYIAFLDSDDAWLPEYLASQMQAFGETPAPDMVCADTRLFGDSSDAGKTFWELYPPREPVTLKALLNRECAIVTSCTVVRRRIVLDAGLFDESFRGPEDFDLWLRIAHRGARIALQRLVLGQRRVHAGAITASGLRLQLEEVRVLDKLERTLDLPADVLSALQQRRAHVRACAEIEQGKQYLEAGDFDRATVCLKNADAFFHSAKLRLALAGLRVVPHLTARAAKLWRLGLGSAAGRGGE
jgi:glycosyltransferase involved in cell wall biosynthesis